MATDRSDNTLTIRILGRDYSIACPEGERERLLHSAEYLSKRMEAIQRRGKMLGMEKIAVMAALNISRDLLEAGYGDETVGDEAGDESEGEASEATRERLAQMQHKIDNTLDSSG